MFAYVAPGVIIPQAQKPAPAVLSEEELMDDSHIDIRGFNPLHRAILAQDDVEFALLLKDKALIRGRDNNHMTPLLLAAQAGHLHYVMTLINRDPKGIMARNKRGQNIFHIAAEKGHDAIISHLLTLGGAHA